MPYNVRLILDEIVRDEQGTPDNVGDLEGLEVQAAIKAVADMERRELQAAKAAKAAETRRLRDKKLADEIHRQVSHTHVAGSSKPRLARKARQVRRVLSRTWPLHRLASQQTAREVEIDGERTITLVAWAEVSN